MAQPIVEIEDLGRMGYEAAYREQILRHEAVLVRRARGASGVSGASVGGRGGVALLVEHDPVITTTRRGAGAHVLASDEALAAMGVALAPTDRGGDVTYHGPGQLVVYPIIDLNALGLKLHAYMRLLEQVVIDALAEWGLEGVRDAGATGVWVAPAPGAPPAKIAAMGVRVRKWVTMHGLALNVDPDMGHFQLIVPCGLAGRPVTSLRALLGDAAPSMAEVKAVVVRSLETNLEAGTQK